MHVCTLGPPPHRTDIALLACIDDRSPSPRCEIFATNNKSFHPVTLQIGFPAPLSQTYNKRRRGMISHFINEPDHWRARAEEARILANQMNDSESKDAMLRIAQDYERLAKRAEHRAAGRLPNWMKH
jgi:hypothetical protein